MSNQAPGTNVRFLAASGLEGAYDKPETVYIQLWKCNILAGSPDVLSVI